MSKKNFKELKKELKRLKREQRLFEKRIMENVYRRIDYLMKKEVASIARWASILTKRVLRIEKELKRIRKNFY